MISRSLSLTTRSLQWSRLRSWTHSKYETVNAAGVAQDVRDHELLGLPEDLVRLRGGRAVGGLGDEPRLDVAGVALGDLVLERGRDEDVAVDLEDLLVADVLRPGEALDGAVLLLPGDHPVDVEAIRVVDATRRVGHGDDRRLLLVDELRRDRISRWASSVRASCSTSP